MNIQRVTDCRCGLQVDMVQAQHTRLVLMVVPVPMVPHMVHLAEVATVAVHRRMVVVLVLMVDMVRLATNKSHCGYLGGGVYTTLLLFRWCFRF